MTSEQFVSRRQARDAERAGLNLPPLTENQRLAEEESISQTPVLEQSSVEVAQTEPEVFVAVQQIATTGVINPYAPKVAAPAKPSQPSVNQVAQQAVQTPMPVAQAEDAAQVSATNYDSTLAEAEEPITEQLFAVSPNLNIEPQTASIIIDNFEPLDNISIAISETGEMLKTGSIELPMISTNTGEMATILDAAQVDEAIAQDSIAGFVSTIAPLRASGVVNTAGKIGIMPSRSARNQGGGWLALALSIAMVTIGGLVLAAFMLGILK